jgi:ferredoxin--NADP+ reductase
MGTPVAAKASAPRSVARAMPVVKGTAVKTITRKPVPVELEKIELPMNTYGNKAPFKARVKSVERIVGPKATGETCHIVIETDGKIPFWEGQSYGVIPPVRQRSTNQCS